jgi:hypothetical protein
MKKQERRRPQIEQLESLDVRRAAGTLGGNTCICEGGVPRGPECNLLTGGRTGQKA